MSDTKPVYKFINNTWVKQDAFQFTNGSWVRISTASSTPAGWSNSCKKQTEIKQNFFYSIYFGRRKNVGKIKE